MRNGDDGPQDERAARAEVLGRARTLIALAIDEAASGATFVAFERRLITETFALGRAVIALFLLVSERRVIATLDDRIVRDGVAFRRAPAQSRNLLTWFGVVRYRRTYLREIGATGKARGFHPLDAELGLLADRLSPSLLSIAVRAATRLSFSEARDLLAWFLPMPPSTEVIESAVIGYGRHTQEWFEIAPAPEDDGDVLVIQIDSEGVPTATDEELRRRRGKRKGKKNTPSPRHRGRQSRERRTKKPRRKKGDKAKNAKMGTMVVMHTLRKQPYGSLLLGPINKRYYASFAPKRHAVEIVAELDRQLARIARTGPGNKFRREKLGEIREYVAKRAALLKYDELIARDLEIGTGPVEGAIKNLMYKRMDHGGMRWIKERAEALLQLRCIDANGDWEAFNEARARHDPRGRDHEGQARAPAATSTEPATRGSREERRVMRRDLHPRWSTSPDGGRATVAS